MKVCLRWCAVSYLECVNGVSLVWWMSGGKERKKDVVWLGCKYKFCLKKQNHTEREEKTHTKQNHKKKSQNTQQEEEYG